MSDKRLLADVEAAFSQRTAGVLVGLAITLRQLEGAIVPGWFHRDRMAALLIPPVTNPMHLVMYQVEQSWHTAFRRDRRKQLADSFARPAHNFERAVDFLQAVRELFSSVASKRCVPALFDLIHH